MCIGFTLKGKPCSRVSKDDYCWQHKSQEQKVVVEKTTEPKVVEKTTESKEPVRQKEHKPKIIESKTHLPPLQVLGKNPVIDCVCNAVGTSLDKRCRNWMDLLRKQHLMKNFMCQALECEKPAAHGAHVLDAEFSTMYLIPFCIGHNVMKNGLRRWKEGSDKSLTLMSDRVFIRLKREVPLIAIDY